MKNYIYIYETPESKKDGLIKIGQTKRPDIHLRIKEQLNTAAVYKDSQLEYELIETIEVETNGDFNFFNGNEDENEKPFTDHVIHKTLKYHNIENPKADKKNSSEWFKISPEKAIFVIKQLLKGLKKEEIDLNRYQNFTMREEQEKAVNITYEFFKNRTEPFLWNAKMRFGKTFTSYQLMKKMSENKVSFKTLIITYKPAVEDAWKEDLLSHKDFKDFYYLQRESLKDINNYKKVVSFASFQDLLSSSEIKDKHTILFDTNWDLLIIDEYHYGASTEKATNLINDNITDEDNSEYEEELEETLKIENTSKSISAKHKLYLSGTPFKAIARDDFSKDSIFNWTYVDEQIKKREYENKEFNPYEALPDITFYLLTLEKEVLDYTQIEEKNEFSLNQFFKTHKGNFSDEKAVKNWLNIISSKQLKEQGLNEMIYSNEENIKETGYPYENINKHKHSFWYLPNVSSVKAMKQLLKEHSFFSQYEIVDVAGKGNSGIDALKPVRKALLNKKNTITLSCGKLTTGVSVPEWDAILFLRDTKSPESYFQAAFRVQTPYKDNKGNILKRKCFVYDFSPNRTLELIASYAENLISDNENGVKRTSEEKIEELLKYLPLLKIGTNTMTPMSGEDVLTFNLDSLNPKELGSKFTNGNNLNITIDKFLEIKNNKEIWAKAEFILNKIKQYKSFSETISVKEIGFHADKIKNIESKKPSLKNEKEKKEIIEEEQKEIKELKPKIDKLKETLKTLLARIPLYMYLTNSSERNLQEILEKIVIERIVKNENGDEITNIVNLFEITTGITSEEFNVLIEIGLIKITSMDGYILKFKQMESEHFKQFK